MKNTGNFVIENDFIVGDYRCIGIGVRAGHRCGYIGLPKGHKLYGIDVLEGGMPITVHGGWTYSDGPNNFFVKSDRWWIGFDCNHWGDGKDLELVKSFEEDEVTQHILMMEEMFKSDDIPKSKGFVEGELREAVRGLYGL